MHWFRTSYRLSNTTYRTLQRHLCHTHIINHPPLSQNASRNNLKLFRSIYDKRKCVCTEDILFYHNLNYSLLCNKQENDLITNLYLWFIKFHLLFRFYLINTQSPISNKWNGKISPFEKKELSGTVVRTVRVLKNIWTRTYAIDHTLIFRYLWAAPMFTMAMAIRPPDS